MGPFLGHFRPILDQFWVQFFTYIKINPKNEFSDPENMGIDILQSKFGPKLAILGYFIMEKSHF